MEQLQNRWYNTLVTGLDLDKNSFQLMQASESIGSSTENLWQLFNSVPPHSLTQVFTPAEFNNFFDDYKAVVMTIIPQSGKEWRHIMGDDLNDWVAYKKKNADQILNKGIEKAFEDWATVNLPDQRARKAVTAYKQMAHGVVNEAVDAVLNPQYRKDGKKNGYPAFSQTIQDLNDAVDHGTQYHVSFDSETASSDVEHTWAKGEVSGLYEFFSGKAGGSYDHLSKKASQNKVSVDVTFQKVATFSMAPGGWYHSNALSLAYNTNDNTVWPAGQKPTWEGTFGDHGNLKRNAVAAIVVDGIDATITSHAEYSSEEQTEIKAETSASYWPFVSFSASGGHSSDVSFDDNGTMTVKMNVKRGNPHILGVNVSPIGNTFSAA